MKSVLMIVHDFPPEGSAGVYRPLRFVRYLPSLGWHPTVIACEKHAYERYDQGLLGLVPRDVNIHRVSGSDPWQAFQAFRARRIERKLTRVSSSVRERVEAGFDSALRRQLREFVRRAESWCYHPDPAMRWIRPAVEEAVKVCSGASFRIIYASAGPLSAFVAAYQASRRTGVPYVLDFRDAWTITYNEFDARRPAWATRRDRALLYRMFTGARGVVFRYHAEAECYWRAYAGALQASKIHIIPNGYDGAVDAAPMPRGDKCAVVYTGTLDSYRYDTLLQGIQQLKQHDPHRAALLSIAFVGEGTRELWRQVEAMELADIVAVRGPVPHAETNDLHRRAHVLLVLGRPSTMKGYELFAGAKVFEYLKAGRPIAGVLPQDETRNILQRVGVATVADVHSRSDIVRLLQQLIDAWSGGSLSSLLPKPAGCQAYSAERQTAALVRALEGAPAADPFVPGVVAVPPSLRADIEPGSGIRGAKEGSAKPVIAQ